MASRWKGLLKTLLYIKPLNCKIPITNHPILPFVYFISLAVITAFIISAGDLLIYKLIIRRFIVPVIIVQLPILKKSYFFAILLSHNSVFIALFLRRVPRKSCCKEPHVWWAYTFKTFEKKYALVTLTTQLQKFKDINSTIQTTP